MVNNKEKLKKKVFVFNNNYYALIYWLVTVNGEKYLNRYLKIPKMISKATVVNITFKKVFDHFQN